MATFLVEWGNRGVERALWNSPGWARGCCQITETVTIRTSSGRRGSPSGLPRPSKHLIPQRCWVLPWVPRHQGAAGTPQPIYR